MAAATLVVYVGVLAAVRLAGRRTLSQISAFDALVTIVLGSVVAAIVVPDRPAVADGAVAVLTLLAAQVAVGWLRQRWPRFGQVVDFAPLTVAEDGEVRPVRSVGSPQMTVGDIESRLRVAGFASVASVGEAIFEPSGEMSVFGRAGPAVAAAPADGGDRGLLERIERAGWEARSASTAAAVSHFALVLADDPVVVMADGRCTDVREEAIAWLAGPRCDAAEMAPARVVEFGATSAGLVYPCRVRSADAEHSLLVTSAYVLAGGCWRMVFHQEAPAPP